MNDRFSLKGKTALVTGGGRGLGKFISAGLAEAGANIIITSRKMKNLEAAAGEIAERYGVRTLAVACDLAREQEIAAMVEETAKTFPKIDILVNNSGATWGAPTLEFPLERWDQLFNINVRGVWILTQKIANRMKEQGGGTVINISSVMGFRGSEEAVHPSVPYNSTKAAVNLLTMNLAVKLAPFKIRVNALALGYFHTDMTSYLDTSDFKEEYETLLGMTPMRRFGDEEDIKGAAIFLASDASAYVNGHVLVCDGGFLAR
ncbi:MAG: 3-oxoacyl-(acyl-carrier-protein) reductase FabG [Syntrophaceae bacterium PtaU1.Bin231]|nr:MAG: 3-oxoacyl-(acyl-carrier-protein) reductase FabG [Syntrophaceae bacterium PtaU1.Bin231]